MKEKSGVVTKFFKILILQNKLICCLCFLLMLVATTLSILLPKILQYIIDTLIPNGEIKGLFVVAFIYIGICLINMGVNIGKEAFVVKLKKKVVAKYKLAILKKVCSFSGKEICNVKTGEILNLLEGDTSLLEGCGIDVIFDTIANFLKAILAFCILLSLQLDMFIYVLLIECIIIFTQLKFTRIITKFIGELRKKAGEIYNLEQEFLVNIFLIALCKVKRYFFRGFSEQGRSFWKQEAKVDMVYCLNNEIGTMLSGVVMVFIYAYGGYKIILGKMTIGALIAFSQYIGMFISPCISLLKSNAAIQKLKVSIKRIYDFLDMSIEIKQNNSGLISEETIKIIEFKNVFFGYTGKNVIENLNFKLEKGKVYAFVGESGCGKSTIVNLLYRLWDINEGEILVNNINIKKINLSNLRKNIAISSQNVYMLDDSIENNITLGKDVDTKNYYEVCRSTGIFEITDGLPLEQQTMVGENAIKLSGGQKQKIALARTLIAARDIVIFDEATSALDNITQNRITTNMRQYYQDKIIVIIAHRLSTIKEVDKIFVMRSGAIQDSGTHDELMRKKGYYYELVTEHEDK